MDRIATKKSLDILANVFSNKLDTKTENLQQEIDDLSQEIVFMNQEDIYDILDIIQGADYSRRYFTIRALETGTFHCKYNSSKLFYSLNGGQWTPVGNDGEVSMVSGDVLRLKNTDTGDYSNGMVDYYVNKKLWFTGNHSFEGNIMSLYWGDDFIGKTTIPAAASKTYLMQNAFYGNDTLSSAENLILPLETLLIGCYYGMFMGCTALVKAPKLLPATTLVANCYSGMFIDCTALTDAPYLPAETIASGAYFQMFYCAAGNPPALTLKCNGIAVESNNALENWLRNRTYGTLYCQTASTIFTPNSVSGLPSHWTRVNY